jgi:SAM-dependent methyltransferase
MKSIYVDGKYLTNNPGWHSSDAPFKAKYVERILVRNDLVPTSIADQGCGSGSVIFELSKKFPHSECKGFEKSPQGFMLCKELKDHQVEFYNKSIEEYSGTFDLVTMMDVFEHVEDYMSFLKMHKGKGQNYIFHIPLDLNVLDILRRKRLVSKREKSGHLHYFSKETALATLRDCGFDIVDHLYTPWCLELQGSSRVRNLLLKTFFRISPDRTVSFFGGFSLMVLTR